ncbi:hypothetical protein [Mycobacteroides chelonae]|uniref:hypothetical protein n=1 Tax=Mycobacteroides chelonae TaxID=1774 RepID=UPI001042065D|nr:hypothetical protein [Mycobacteroides chelonae]
MNEALREHVTSIGFALTLSKAQIELLVVLHHFKGYNGACRAGYRPSHFVSTIRSLERRGLTENTYPAGNLTKAGALVCEILREAGLYDEVLERKSIDRNAA